MTSQLEPIVTLPWLVRLRWAFLVGQLLVLPIAHAVFQISLDPRLIGTELAVMVATNLALHLARHRMRWSRARVIGAVMLVDTALLTLLLAGSGGSANPFTVLYLVHITLSAIVLSAWWVAAIASASLAGFGLLFATSSVHAMHQMMGFARHLQLMWIAFALAALLIAFFVGRVTREIFAQREQISTLREAGERHERLASVTRLAANAAHELGSPLATIAVAAHEARLRARDPGVAKDLELIAMEVERCREILGRMTTRGADESRDVLTFAGLADAIRDQLDEESALRVDVTGDEAGSFVAPRDQLVQSILALIDNALEATEERVTVALARDRGVAIRVIDRGGGIDASVLARIGSPFFTTKGAGHGLGLGVFLARAFCESHGGSLTLASERGRGTHATIRLPLEPAG